MSFFLVVWFEKVWFKIEIIEHKFMSDAMVAVYGSIVQYCCSKFTKIGVQLGKN